MNQFKINKYIKERNILVYGLDKIKYNTMKKIMLLDNKIEQLQMN